MNEKTKLYLVPGAIVIAGLLIAISVFITGNLNKSLVANVGEGQPETAQIKNLKPVNAKDHILGNAEAKVKIVEFSDMDCPYCKRFNATIREVLTAYGDKIGVVYRHFPLAMLHPNAEKEAEATECAGELGGNEAFWKYFDQYESEIESGKTFSNDLMLSVAEFVGLDKQEFESCLQSNKPTKLVKEDVDNATEIGVAGTPFSIIVVNGKPTDTIKGAYPIEAVKSQLDQYIK